MSNYICANCGADWKEHAQWTDQCPKLEGGGFRETKFINAEHHPLCARNEAPAAGCMECHALARTDPKPGGMCLRCSPLETALRTLRNEVRGTLRAHELAIRYDSGNSNWKCLEMALEMADTALASTAQADKPSDPVAPPDEL